MGWLRFFEAGRKFDCINSLNTVRIGHSVLLASGIGLNMYYPIMFYLLSDSHAGPHDTCAC